MRWRYYIPIILLLWGWCKAGAQELPLTHFTSDSEVNALPSALVTHIYQDRMGYMWFAVFTSGLVRYDGSQMEIFNEKHGLGDLSIWQIAEDGEGYLWVSSNGGVVVSEKPLQEYRIGQKAKFTSVFQGIPLFRDALNSQQLTVDKTGRVWIGTKDQGILRYHIDKNSVITVDTLSTAVTGKEMLDVRSLRATHDGSVLAGLEGGLITEFKNKRYHTFYGTKEGTKDSNFSSFYEDREKGIWAYRSDGEILRFRSRSQAPEIIFAGLPAGGTSITAIKDGTILAGNLESGITRIDPGTGKIINSYTRSNGLLTNNVYHIFEDREGNIWIGQSGGVSKLRHNFDAFENFTPRSIAGGKAALPTGKVNTVLVPEPGTGPCRFWVGTEGGGVTCVDQYGSSRFLTQADGLVGDWVNGLSMDEQGRIWIATTQGLNAIVFDKDLLIEEASNVREITILGREGFVFSLWDSPGFVASEKLRLQDDENDTSVESIWFAGIGLYTFADGQIFELGSRQGLPETIYKAVAMDMQGYLWVGTEDRGLYRSSVKIDLEKLKNTAVSDEVIFKQVWSRDKGAPTNNIEKLLFDGGKLWVGTQLGLFALDPATASIIKSVTQKNGLPADNAVSFALSPVTGHLWVGTNGGLAEVDPEDGKVFNVVTRKDGLVDNEVWLFGSVKVDAAGNVFYGTSKGLSIYHPQKDRPNIVPPKLQLTSAEISYKSDSRNEVTFEYTALSFANVGEVKYRTRLLGYENNWSPPSGVKRLRYTNLPAYLWPEEYTLEVMAENESGVAAEKLQYSFVVEPVWWLQWWAFLIYLLMLVGMVVTVDRVQRHRLITRERNNARIREAELQAETANARSAAAESEALALQAENEKKAFELQKARELEKAYNELKTTQNQLIQAEKMASLGRLATGVAHEIKNPLNFINNFAELSVDLVAEIEEARKTGDESEINLLMQDLKENTTKIEKHGKRADAIVRSMMQHARGGESVFEMFDLNELVNDYLDLAYRGKINQHPEMEVTIEKHLDPNVGKLKLVGQEVGQVLLNVIGNSLDAVLIKKKSNGELFEPLVKVKTRKAGEFAEIIISDNGPGVPEEIRERIFEPFFTTKPTGEGTGLGLSLSYNIITQGHNGSLKLISENGEGAKFVISLPIHKDHPKKKVMA